MQSAKIQPPERKPLSPLDAYRALFAEELRAVDAQMRAMADDRAPLIRQIVEHIISSGGKRIRPILLILSAKLCGYSQGERHIRLAAAVEFLHTATLLHDDVVDESSLRRGHKTANAIWGNAPSVLVGDFLLSRAFQLMARDGSLEVLRILSDASAVITEGEVKQLMAANDITTDQETYIDIIASKTSQLFSAATKVGAVVAGKSEQEAERLWQYGQHLGTAFQLADDALDYSARQEELGKTIGDDFREGKVTLPVILAYNQGNGEEKAFWERVVGNPESQSADDLAAALAILRKYDALNSTLTLAHDYAEQSVRCLSGFPDGPFRRVMTDIAYFATRRGH